MAFPVKIISGSGAGRPGVAVLASGMNNPGCALNQPVPETRNTT